MNTHSFFFSFHSSVSCNALLGECLSASHSDRHLRVYTPSTTVSWLSSTLVGIQLPWAADDGYPPSFSDVMKTSCSFQIVLPKYGFRAPWLSFHLSWYMSFIPNEYALHAISKMNCFGVKFVLKTTVVYSCYTALFLWFTIIRHMEPPTRCSIYFWIVVFHVLLKRNERRHKRRLCAYCKLLYICILFLPSLKQPIPVCHAHARMLKVQPFLLATVIGL